MAKANERFRLVWSSSRSDWMIAPETAKGIGAPATVSNAPISSVVEGCLMTGCHSLTSHAQKLVTQFAANNKKSMLQSLASLRLSTAIALMFAGVAPSVVAQALQDPTVRSGAATIDLSNASHAVITQQSNKAIIDWRQFSIPSGSTVQFVQPSASSMVLNRVTGTQASQIDGNLLANGQVWLLNPSGVMIGNGGSINTASFLASTLDINNNDFLNGRYRFDATSNTTGRIVNAGTIKAAENGYVVLSGAQINNEGVIEAKLGSVLLGSGQAMTLDMVGDKLLSFAINTPVATLPTDGKASIENSGRITAQGGKVMMTARTATDVMHSVINVSGVVEATSARLVNGEIVLDGGSTGSVTVSGSLVANGLQAGETGGAIKVFGKDINLANNALLDARGDVGGGVIHVGGGWQGSDLAGRTAALTTKVASNALLDASAISKGNGGEIAIWSDIHNKQSITNVSGILNARGGATSGNGGRIETSGYLLGTNGVRVDASATKGLSGEWLLDPFNISIESGAGASTINNGTFFPTNVSVIDVATIQSALSPTGVGSTGTTVKISTGSGAATDGGDINIIGSINSSINGTPNGTLNISGPATSSLILHANRNINISNANITVGGLALNTEYGGINILANSVLNTSGAFLGTSTNSNQSNLFLVAGGSFSATTPYQINASTPSFINLSNSKLISSGDIIGGTAGSITINNSTVNANADISFEARGGTFVAANSVINSAAAGYINNQTSAIKILAGGAWTFNDAGRPYNFSSGAASTVKIENTNITMSATTGFVALLSSGELQITSNSHLDAGEGILLISQGGPLRITSSNFTIGAGVATAIDAIKGLVAVTGGDLTFETTTNTVTGIKLAGAGSSGDIILTGANITSSINDIYAAAAGGINVTNSTVSAVNGDITAVAGGKIILSSGAYFDSANAGVYSRSSAFQLDSYSATSSGVNTAIAGSGYPYSASSTGSVIVTSSSGRSKLIGSATNTVANANAFELGVEADVKFSSTPFVPQIVGAVGGAIAAIQGSLSPSAMLPPPPVPQAPQPIQPQPAPQPVQQNQQPQPQPNQQPAADSGASTAPSSNQPQANQAQQPAGNKPPPKDGASADSADSGSAPPPKQAANDPAPAAPAPSTAPRQAANNAPAPAPAPAPQSAPANNAAPAPVAPAAPTQVSLAAPPPPVAPPPPTPVAAEKPPTPKDAADSGDKTLAMAAPPPQPKPAAQSQASSARTSVVSPGLVDVQVPVPPRPPSGAAAEQPVPTMGNSARW